MKVVIIEDESIAIRKLKKLLYEINSDIKVIAELESVLDAKEWFRQPLSQEIDLCFSDIQLLDGLSFEIYEDIDANFPIIFTTAYDEYALRAFKLNGVDYLLKPIQKEELVKALQKFEKTRKQTSNNQSIDFQQVIKHFQQSLTSPSFISYYKDKIIPLPCENIAYFYAQNHIIYALVDKNEYVLDNSMEEIESRLPEFNFFRANRQFIIQRKFILNAEQYFNNRLMVHLSVKTPESIIISREKTSLFKKWLSGI